MTTTGGCAGVAPVGQTAMVGASRYSGRIAFICAMPIELRPLVRRLSLRQSRIGGVSVHSGVLGDHAVVAIVTGMGTKLAARGTEDLVGAIPIDRIVVVGMTGAVDNSTPIGTLILPEVVVNGATGTEYRPDYQGDGTPFGKLWTTDELLTDLDVLAGLRAQGIVSLDMETAAIAEVCQRYGIVWSVFRSVSDRAADGSVDEEVLKLSNQDGTPNGWAIGSYLLRHTGRIRPMLRLAKGAKLATATAAEAAIRACS